MTTPMTGGESLARTALRLQTFLASDGASPGLLSQLRRMDPQAPGLGAVTSVLRILPPDADAKAIQRWLAVAKAMALAGPENHRDSVPLGAALREAKVSELRFERLFTSAADVLNEAVWRACRLLKAKRVKFNFIDLAALLVTRDNEKAADLRLRQAMAYLRAAA